MLPDRFSIATLRALYASGAETPPGVGDQGIDLGGHREL